jgi:hypothetical protein
MRNMGRKQKPKTLLDWFAGLDRRLTPPKGEERKKMELYTEKEVVRAFVHGAKSVLLVLWEVNDPKRKWGKAEQEGFEHLAKFYLAEGRFREEDPHPGPLPEGEGEENKREKP